MSSSRIPWMLVLIVMIGIGNLSEAGAIPRSFLSTTITSATATAKRHDSFISRPWCQKARKFALLSSHNNNHHHHHHQGLSSVDILFGNDNIVLTRVRGGAQVVQDDDDDDDEDEVDVDEDEEDEDEDDEDDLFDGQDLDSAEDEFAEENYLERTLDAWAKGPPLTKGYLTASFVATMFGFLFHKNEFPPWLLLEWKPLYTKMQLWRPFTAFLNLGPFGMGYLLTAQFVWTYMSQIERLHHANPFDFWIMILFGQVSMVIGYPIFKLSPKFLGHNISTFLVYIWSRFHEGMEVNIFELVNIKAELLPWFFLAQVRRVHTVFGLDCGSWVFHS